MHTAVAFGCRSRSVREGGVSSTLLELCSVMSLPDGLSEEQLSSQCVWYAPIGAHHQALQGANRLIRCIKTSFSSRSLIAL